MYLNCHSYHSLRYGTIPLSDLVLHAKQCNVKAMALTDINTVTGIYDFIKECKSVNIKPLVGIEFRNNNKLLYIGIAKNNILDESTLVYPNPTNGLVTILVENNTGTYTFEAFDLTSKLVYKSNLLKAETSINISALANGLYTYKITLVNTKQVIKQGKLIKE